MYLALQGALARADNLWQSTCFELFVAPDKTDRYLELNISPSGAWNCYAFDHYRMGMCESDAMTLAQLSTVTNESLTATLLLDDALGNALTLSSQVSPTAVLQDTSGSLHYFAMTHGDQPDFHNREHYVQLERDHL